MTRDDLTAMTLPTLRTIAARRHANVTTRTRKGDVISAILATYRPTPVPMSHAVRVDKYRAQNGSARLTARQIRQSLRMLRRNPTTPVYAA